MMKGDRSGMGSSTSAFPLKDLISSLSLRARADRKRLGAPFPFLSESLFSLLGWVCGISLRRVLSRVPFSGRKPSPPSDSEGGLAATTGPGQIAHSRSEERLENGMPLMELRGRRGDLGRRVYVPRMQLAPD